MVVTPPLLGAVSIAGLILCFWHASERSHYVFFAAATAYGYLLEQAAIATSGSYHYHAEAFPLMVLDVPVTVAFTWAGILYASWQTGLYLGLSRRALPFFAALFVLHIDLAMDVVAIQVPLWTWGVDGLWFGVPLSNFFGWYMVAFVFLGSYFVLERYADRFTGGPIATAGASIGLLLATLLASFALLFVALILYSALFAWSTVAEALVLVAIVQVAVVVVLSEDLDPRPIPRSLVAIPMIGHLFFLWLGFAIGLFQEQPLALVVAIAMLGLGILIHVVPHWHARRSSAPVRT